ncbi:prolyl-tRNA synthetase associated domain-containing protein [Caldimonas tepidiphila]|uniref:prolyl-tRNA synthetase associated domain-containing protein n=1 Tax=Caldimonas tepidiphila TaxID=2315841 RepID=UPI001F0C019D|nr:prolyl-tRNA synthetase associated domain-containing protein [Caldimonas tepidiphila]
MELKTEICAAEELVRLLEDRGLAYEMVEHVPVFTIEDALKATPSLDGIKTKNVFLRDAKGARHFLVIVPHDKRLDLAALAGALSTTKLSMGSPDRLQRHLGVTPGAVSVFALINDAARAVELVIDAQVWAAEKVQAHPLRNTATVSLPRQALETFLSMTGHAPVVIPVP